MDLLKTIWPVSFKTKHKDVTSLVVMLIVHLVAGLVAGLVISLVAWVPVVGWLFSIVGSVLGLYVLVGIVLTVLDWLEILK